MAQGLTRTHEQTLRLNSSFHLNLTQLQGTAYCFVAVKLRNNSKTNLININFWYFEKQQAVRFFMPETLNQGKSVTVLVDGQEVGHWNLTGQKYVHKDLSSCRHSESGVQVVGVVQERRRKDVMFLDRVIIHHPDVDIHLGQGGRVEANNAQLKLSNSPEAHHGVDFMKDETGVTANMTHSNYSTLVFFDGYTVHIHTTHSWMLKVDKGLQGLCGNFSQSSIDTKDLEFSSSSCEVQFNDTVDSSINCPTVNERCELLRGWHFSDCQADINPEPYIISCNSTLCQYPDVDGLRCQFLEAYTKACSLKNHTVADWRTMANCSTQAFCNDTLCVDHEFCAEGLSGDIRCFCRDIFVSDYRSNNSLGQPVVCSPNSASMTLLGCLLEEIDVDYSDLHLNEDSCRGDRDMNHMVTFRFNQSNVCGVEVMANNSHVVYKNNFTIEGGTTDVIDRFNQFDTLDFSCFSGQPDIQSMAFKIRANSVVQQMISGSWNYSVKMTAYTDADHRHAVTSDTEIQMNQTVFVELKVYDLLDNLVNLMFNDDHLVKVQVNGEGTSSYFSFNMFHFSGRGHGIYLHCKLHLCAKQNVTCGPMNNDDITPLPDLATLNSNDWASLPASTHNTTPQQAKEEEPQDFALSLSPSWFEDWASPESPASLPVSTHNTMPLQGKVEKSQDWDSPLSPSWSEDWASPESPASLQASAFGGEEVGEVPCFDTPPIFRFPEADVLFVCKAAVRHIFIEVLQVYVKKACYGCRDNHLDELQHMCLYISDDFWITEHFYPLLGRLNTPRFLPAIYHALALFGAEADVATVRTLTEVFLAELQLERDITTIGLFGREAYNILQTVYGFYQA
ncbi:uncharacterized protein LOC129187243 [Dunckerocampus dactyliophorus]|uniref:uncharacterized protein LOC129187243 n=1 Tax=Dunckerocampus dactyliophorus TaxID=161453 RepID=UPI002406E18B|nr:uncharacterized protein LOC129187243 [Dunckerocampus dactyliophorus]